MFVFYALFILYLFYIQTEYYAKMHVLVLLDILGFLFLSITICFFSLNIEFTIKTLFLILFVFLTGAINTSLIGKLILNNKQKT